MAVPKKMTFPKRLRPGETVALVAPSSPVSPEDALACIKYFEERGYHVRMGDYVYAAIHGYEAGTPQVRADAIDAMFADPEVRAIFCIRGGDSGAHIVDRIDIETVRRNPKIFVGYSDVTTLHVRFNQEAGLVTFHGPMVKVNMIRNFDDFSDQSLRSALNMEGEFELELTNPKDEPFRVLREGTAEGRLVGGNLALITSMLGTPYEVDTRGKILFFEDVDETVTRIDRMLHHLRFAGKIDDAAGILVGDFSNCPNPHDAAYDVAALLEDFFAAYEKPVISNIRSGHCLPMSTLPLGATCHVDTKLPSIRFLRE